MPFCSQCGNEVAPRDAYCGHCGSRQPLQAMPSADPFSQISPRTAAICCYIPGVGWIASILVLAAQRFRQDRILRFHAFQGLYLFVAWLLDGWVLRPLSPFVRVPLHGLVELVLLFASVWMIVKTAHGEVYSLPLFGELAQRSVAED